MLHVVNLPALPSLISYLDVGALRLHEGLVNKRPFSPDLVHVRVELATPVLDLTIQVQCKPCSVAGRQGGRRGSNMNQQFVKHLPRVAEGKAEKEIGQQGHGGEGKVEGVGDMGSQAVIA